MRFAPAAVLVTLMLATLAHGQSWTPLTTGAAGALNSENGDAGFVAEYFANADLSGKPTASRLETAIRAKAALPPGVAAGGPKSVRWTTAVVPKRTGPHQFALKSSAGATLSVDGKVIVTVPAAGSAQRVAATVPLEAGKSYAVVIALRDPKGDATLAAEWFPPATDAPTVAPKPATPIAAAPRTKIGAATTLRNDAYTLAASPEGVLTLTETATGVSATFAPDVSVVFQPAGTETKLDAKGTRYVDDTPVGGTNYIVPAWNKEVDFLAAAKPRATLRPTSSTSANDAIRWTFPPQAGYAVAATVALPKGTAEPTVTLTLTPKQAGSFSVGYVGAPAVTTDAADWIWQPLVWTGRRFPNRSYLTTEYELPIPAAMVGQGGVAIGVAADPKEMPFRMPTYANSRFGVLLRDENGAMRPQLFAPVLGTPDSAMRSGETYTFTVRLVARKGDWYAAYRHLGQSLYAFGDQRENGVSNLNATIDNFVALINDDRYSYWHARYKTWGYQNDGGPDAGRQQSAADALSLALVCDDRTLLETRALPTLEYMLSRKSLSTKFSEADFMGGFVRSAPSDLVAAYALTGNRSTAIRELVAPLVDIAKKTKAGGNAIDAQKDALAAALSTYRLTNDPAALAAARSAADAYIALRVAKPAADFGDVGSSFWTELAPAYDALFELYAITDDAKYRDAAAAALREFSGFVYLVPPIPSCTITANKGGTYNGQPVPEETVPAWRVAANGLTAECAGTAHSHRGVFMASYAAYMARLGGLTNDTLLRDIARSAVVGRYANYPSYAYRNGYSTVFEKADYPLRSFEEIKKFTSAHYNHLVPMAAFLVDYLVGETAARSRGAVDFPGELTNTGAYFRNRVYGARPGTFYDDRGVNLWLPRGLVTTDGTIQLNTLSGYGNGRLYLALANQLDESVTTTLTIDPRRVDLKGSHATRVWIDNAPGAPVTTTDGKLRITVSPKGLTCVAIDGARVTMDVNGAMLDESAAPVPAGSRQTATAAFGEVTATALRLGKGLTRVHVFTTAKPDAVRSATLVYTVDGKATRLPLKEFPFEATVAVDDAARAFACSVEVVDAAGAGVTSPTLTLPLAAAAGR